MEDASSGQEVDSVHKENTRRLNAIRAMDSREAASERSTLVMKIEDAQFMHITIDALGAKNCDDEKTVEFFLHHAAKEMGMIPVGPSMVYGFPKRDEHTDSGFTGVQVIMESHISIHTFPEAGNLVCIDLSSR